MFKNPDSSVHILTDDEFKHNIKKICDELEKIRQNGYFTAFDSVKLYYEYFLCENPKGSIIIVHGLSEFTKKYYELIYYFLSSGYNAFIFDQRCHGFSERLTDTYDLIHVEHFGDYVKDLEYFTDNVVSKVSPLPISIYSHSMGGAVTSLYLMKNPDKIKKAVLSAPMFEPVRKNVPYIPAIAGAYLKKLIQGKKSKFFKDREFNPPEAIKSYTDKCPNRFFYNLDLRCNEPNYRSTPLTSGWVYNSLLVRRRLSKRRVSKISTDILAVIAECDTAVVAGSIYKFAKNCKACTIHTLKGTGHSILTSNDEIISEHINTVLEFYN